MTVLKFGGSSLATPERILNACTIMQTAIRERGAVAMVCSALGGVTNQLISLANLAAQDDHPYDDVFEALKKRHLNTARALVKGPFLQDLTAILCAYFEELKQSLAAIRQRGYTTREHLDRIMGFGEHCSAQLVHFTLAHQTTATAFCDARTIIRTDNRFGHAQVDMADTQQLIAQWFTTISLPAVVTGFIASDSNGASTTLGRGGSDYTAALLGTALRCEQIEIWTDVNGFMTADPNQVPEAFSPRTLTFEDALELAYLGAKVIYPPTLIPAMNANVPVLVKNCFHPNHPGTLIEKKRHLESSAITGITAIDTLTQIKVDVGAGGDPAMVASLIQETLAPFEGIINLHRIENTRCRFFLDQRHPDWAELEASLRRHLQPFLADAHGWTVTFRADSSLVAVVGEGLGNPRPIFQKIKATLNHAGIPILAWGQCHSHRNICVAVHQSHRQATQRHLHNTFFSSAKIPATLSSM